MNRQLEIGLIAQHTFANLRSETVFRKIVLTI